jgi:hypothetical protein
VTIVFVVFATIAVNCAVPPPPIVTLDGLTPTLTAGALGMSVTEADAD